MPVSRESIMPLRAEYIRSLPLLFGRPVLAEFARTGYSRTFERLTSAAGFDNGYSVAELYDLSYNALLNAYRCEYVFKNCIARRLLLERHPWGEARLFTEFRVGTRKADVVILNGTSTVYEIKTGLDNLDRLQEQITSYRSVFDMIYVVCESTDVDRLSTAAGRGVGVIALTAEGELVEHRAAEPNADRTIPAVMLSSLRKSEYLDIIRAEGRSVPEVPNGLQWDACLKIADSLNAASVHARMVHALRARPVEAGLREIVSRAPTSLIHAMLTFPAGIAERTRLADALLAPAVH
jgi:hypothetical protein